MDVWQGSDNDSAMSKDEESKRPEEAREYWT